VSDQAAELRRRLVDPRAVAEALGLVEGAKRQARGIMIRCPWHVERTPSCSVTVGTDGTVRVHCFGCERGGDVLHLVAGARGLDVHRDFPRVLAEAAQLAGVTLDDVRELRGIRMRSSRQRAPSTGTTPRPNATPPPTDERPPRNEVSGVWAGCVPVYDDADLRSALEARAIDPAVVSDRDLARALPASVRLPDWAYYGRRSWATLGNRLVLPMFDDAGGIVSLHARRVSGAGQAPKGLSPKDCRIAGTVFADPLARLLLAGEPVEWWRTKTVIVSEGVPDFLTVATHYGDADEHAPAVVGVIAGSFTEAIGMRLPAGSTVALRTHRDTAGDHYADAVVRTLGRRCNVLRAAAAFGEAHA
jgi:hypothetical protein